MQYDTTQTARISLIGLSINTSFTEQKDAGDIKALWERWFSENISSLIPNQVDSNIYNVYHNYQDEDRGEYSVLLGHRVSTLEDIPEGLSGISFRPGQQAVHRIDGPLPEAVIQAWQSIRSSSDYERAYIADYDVYDFSDNTQGTPMVHTYVSIQNR